MSAKKIRGVATPRGARLRSLKLTKHVCPNCGHRGLCTVSEHYYFAGDKIALRCQKCFHIWAVA